MYGTGRFPSFAKEGWTRPKENAAEHPLKGADGVVVSSYRLFTQTVLIIGGLKQPPRLRRLRNRGHFLYGAATPPSRRREFCVSHHFGNLDSSASIFWKTRT